MITYDVTINSKNKQALVFFFLFLNKIKKPKINLLSNSIKQKTLTKKITTLKSPHVNKKAQTQLEYRIFSKKVYVSSYNEIKFLIFLKKFKIKLFSEIKFKIKISNKKNFSKNNLLNPKSYYITSIIVKKNKKIKNIKPCYKIKNYLKILDCYGELNIKNYI